VPWLHPLLCSASADLQDEVLLCHCYGVQLVHLHDPSTHRFPASYSVDKKMISAGWFGRTDGLLQAMLIDLLRQANGEKPELRSQVGFCECFACCVRAWLSLRVCVPVTTGPAVNKRNDRSQRKDVCAVTLPRKGPVCPRDRRPA
jgi:hypothetical protein